jgi:hypothetical protein
MSKGFCAKHSTVKNGSHGYARCRPGTHIKTSSDDFAASKAEEIALEERATTLRDVAQQMKENSFTGDPPRFTREELHERR